jgi:hypothetical protein
VVSDRHTEYVIEMGSMMCQMIPAPVASRCNGASVYGTAVVSVSIRSPEASTCVTCRSEDPVASAPAGVADTNGNAHATPTPIMRFTRFIVYLL